VAKATINLYHIEPVFVGTLMMKNAPKSIFAATAAGWDPSRIDHPRRRRVAGTALASLSRATGRCSGASNRVLQIIGWVFWARQVAAASISRFTPMHGSGADAEFLRGSENTRARRQLRPDSLNHFGTHGATLEPLRLAQRPRKGSFDS
jgi:hypothetical protein